MLCIVGKTPKEDGDNKIFVEKARQLTRENAASVGREMAFGTSFADYVPESFEKSLTITLSQKDIKEKAEALKVVFAAHPGQYRVFIKSNGSTIRTQTTVDKSDALIRAIEAVVGVGSVS